jgi:FkbM family methyltransferase
MLLKTMQIGERAFQLLQGKGLGSHSLRSEARTAGQFLRNSGSVVFDVGANIGLWTNAILKRHGEKVSQVHMFEPSKANCDVLTQLKDPRMVINAFGLGDKEERRQLHSDKPGSGLASLYDRNIDHHGIAMNLRELVSISTLDKYVESNHIEHIDVLKLDVEGHELAVLAGAQKTLERRISAIQFEFGGCNIDSRTYFRDLWLFLNELGFRIAVLSPLFGLLRIPRYSESLECFATTNYFAFRQTKVTG